MPNNRSAGGADHVVSDRTLDRFRTTAALLAAVPELAAKVRIGDQTCLEIRWPPFDGDSPQEMAPCTFHRAIAGAVQLRKAGERIATKLVPAGYEPAVDWGVPAGGRIVLGGVVRVPRTDSWLHATVALADPTTVDAAIRGEPAVHAHHDEALGASVLCARSALGDAEASSTLTESLVTLVARIGVDDLEGRLGAPDELTAARPPWL